MSTDSKHLDDLRDIKSIMQKSSRFIGLSGWSGIFAGICALVGAWYVSTKVECWKGQDCDFANFSAAEKEQLDSTILLTGVVVFVVAFILAFLFTYLSTKKAGTGMWNFTGRRLMINVAVPILVGGIFIYKMLILGVYDLILPASLIFYGLGLVNAGKYTVSEVGYLGFGHLVLGIVGCLATQYGLYFWALGFGVLHIIYGIVMWYKYERS